MLINGMNYLASLVSQVAIASTQFQMNLFFNQMDNPSVSKSSSSPSSSSSSSFQTWMIATVQVKTEQPSFQIELSTQSCRHNHHHQNTVIIINIIAIISSPLNCQADNGSDHKPEKTSTLASPLNFH